MKIRTKNKQLARLRKRNALAQSLRRDLLCPPKGNGERRQLAVDPAHRQPLGPRGPMRSPVTHSETVHSETVHSEALHSETLQPEASHSKTPDSETFPASSQARRADASAGKAEPSEAARLSRNTPQAPLFERKGSRKMRPRAQIVTYGAAAIADGTRIVRVDASVDITSVREGDRFGVDAMGRSATFEVISVGFRPHSLEVDRPLPRGRYGWSIQRDRDGADRGCGMSHETAALAAAEPIPPATNSATVSPPPLMSDPALETDQRIRDTSVMWFDGKTRIERDVPRDPHLSNEGNQLDGNEATFAFWFNRTATVIRPETLVLGVDQVTGEAFTIALFPTLVSMSSNDAPLRFDLEVTPKSGHDARPVRWTVEHPRSQHEWQFIALVTDCEGGVRLWINGRGGERQQSTAGIAHHDYLSLGDGVLRHGVRPDGIETLIPTGLRDSLLDSFAVWSRSLSGTEVRRAMTDSPLTATQDGSLQLYWQLSTSVHASTARLFGNSGRPSNLILDASGTLRHGTRITGLQSQQQDWRGMLDYDAPSDLAG